LEPDGYPTQFVRALTVDGWLAALIPERYGGQGLSLTAASVILEEINAAGGNAAACHAQMYTMGTILRHWTSRALHSDLMLLLARTSPREEMEKPTDGLSVFLVDLREQADAIRISPIRTMLNHSTTEVFLDELPLPRDALIGEEGKGFRYILDGMNAERILIAAECIGDGRWFVERARRYAGERVVFGRPIGANQGVQFPIAQAHIGVCAADLMRFDAARRFDASLPCGEQANAAKYLASEASWAAANVALDVHGGFGFAHEYGIERKFRETRLYRIAPVSNNLVLSYIGQHVLGLPRSY